MSSNNVAFPSMLYSVVESCSTLAENSRWDAGPDQHYIQVSKLDLVSDGSPGSGLFRMEASIGKKGLVPLPLTFFLSTFPIPSPSAPPPPTFGSLLPRHREEGAGQFLPNGFAVWMTQQCSGGTPWWIWWICDLRLSLSWGPLRWVGESDPAVSSLLGGFQVNEHQ